MDETGKPRYPAREHRPPPHLNDFELNSPAVGTEKNQSPAVDDQHDDEYEDLSYQGDDLPADDPDAPLQNQSPAPSVKSNKSKSMSVTSVSSQAKKRMAEVELREAENLAAIQRQIDEEATNAEVEAAIARAEAEIRVTKMLAKASILKKKLGAEEKLSQLRVTLEKSRIEADDDEADTRSYSPPPPRTSSPKVGFLEKTESWLQTQHRNVTTSSRVPPSEPYGSRKLNPNATPFRPPQLSSTPNPQHVPSNQAFGGESQHQTVHTYRKFPDLPFFGGDIKDWPIFISNYRQSTTLYDIPHVYNIARLSKALKGEAKNAVHALLMHEGNIPQIIKVLERQFGRPTEIIETMIEEIQKLPIIKPQHYQDLIQFANHVSNMMAMIHTFGRPEYAQNPILMKELKNKLPGSTLEKWVEFTSYNDSTSLEVFAMWLDAEAEKYIPFASSCPKQAAKTENPRNHNQRAPRAIHVAAEPEPENKKPETEVKKLEPSQGQKPATPAWNKCNYCDKPGHRTWMCRQLVRDQIGVRRSKAKEKNLCFGCLGVGHGILKCTRKRDCPESGCGKDSHKLLHEHTTNTTRTSATPPTNGQIGLMNSGGRIGRQILPVLLRNGDNQEKVFAFLDLGSDFTLLDVRIAKKLGLDGPSEPLRFDTLGGPVTIPSKVLNLEILNPVTADKFKMENVRSHPDLSNLKRGSFPLKALNKWKHLKPLMEWIDLPMFVNEQPLMLIGLPHAHLITPTQSYLPEKNGPVAAYCPLGWTIHGDLSLPDSTESLPRNYFLKNPQIMHTAAKSDEPLDQDLNLHKLVEGYFENETLGIKPRTKEDSSPEVRRALELANSTLQRVDDRFEIGLLWRNQVPNFPNNYLNALNRLKSQERKMDKDPVYAKRYGENMQTYIDKGYIRKLSLQEAARTSPKTWYLPHFSVINPQKPEKMRMVLDAAAVTSGTSFNSELLPGPDILKPLPGILCKFRERKIGLAADIREMFHQVRIKLDDQEAQRILWRGMDRNREPDVYVMQVMIFGATCSPFCAQFVKNFNAEQHVQEFPEAVSAIIHNHYVDDLLCSADSEQEALNLYNGVSEVHRRGGFTICNWISNSPRVIQKVPVDLRSKSLKTFTGKEEIENEKILGLVWNPQLDTFKFNTTFAKVPKEILLGEEVPSRRQILSTVMSVYDPLGFSANIGIKAKLLLQKCWKLGIGWDDPITDTLFEQWKLWLELIRQISEFSLPRCYSPKFSSADNIQLHVFCDASDQAYGTVAYFRILKGSEIETLLVSSKSKVLPVKQSFKENVSVPRAELQAAVLGTRLANSLQEWHSIKPNRIIFWSDNTTVLHWLKMDHSRLKQFVSNRIAEIQDSTTIDQWHYVPTDLNVADDVTKGHLSVSFASNSRWIIGPEFLKLDEEEWPKMPSTVKLDAATIQSEMKKEFVGLVSDENNQIFDFNAFSSYTKLVRVTAYVQRFIDLKVKKKALPKYLTTKELQLAEKILFKISQSESYPTLVQVGVNKSPNLSLEKVQKEYNLGHLSLFIDQEGLIRMKGRVQHQVPGSSHDPNPILLSPSHPLTKLIVQDQHEKFLHQGREAVVNAIKAKFCIPTVREAVKKVLSNCQKCKNSRAVPKPPQMAPLPSCRTAVFTRPFTNTGVDYFGPILVSIGRRAEKRYGVLFTCMTTRAVHVELAVDLSADGFINCLRRFICDRSCPANMYSDNGTNFVGAEAELKLEFQKLKSEEEKIQSFVSLHQMTWQFIPPHAPHMGGCWERMVRSIKTCLYASLKERQPKEDTLRTFLKEAQAVVNSHPLGYVSSDLESGEVLTPNHFLFGTATIVHPPGIFDDVDLLRTRQWRIAQQLANHFWKRWIKEILPILNPRSKWLQLQEPLKIGDVVLILDDNAPRCSWPRGRIIKLFPGKDGQTRYATVKTFSGEYTRPTTKLAVLDVLPEDEHTLIENRRNQINCIHEYFCPEAILRMKSCK